MSPEDAQKAVLSDADLLENILQYLYFADRLTLLLCSEARANQLSSVASSFSGRAPNTPVVRVFVAATGAVQLKSLGTGEKPAAVVSAGWHLVHLG
jgi:hypothetical protein